MLSVSGPRSYTFARDGGTQSFTFTCNRDWSISTTENWISVSPSSGTASEEGTTVTIKCNPNSTYDPRTASLTVMAEDLAETITVNQETGIGLIVSPNIWELTNAKQIIEIEVQKNVQYSIAIDDESSQWIKQGGTKALTTDNITFTIEENTSYDNREGKIVFKQLDGGLTETVIVKQAWGEGLIAEKNIYDVPYEGGTVDVNMRSNVDYEVASGADWIHYIGTKALSSSTVSLTVDLNNSYTPREGSVTIKKKEGYLSTAITIRQAPMIAVESVTISKKELFLKVGETSVLSATINPNNATVQTVTWVSSDESVVTIDDTGNVTALKKGKATISAKAEEKEGTCLVYVDCIPDDEIWYTTADGQPLTLLKCSSLSNTYSDGKYRMRLIDALTVFAGFNEDRREQLKTIILPESVSELEDHCFLGCFRLVDITLPDNLKVIGYRAFSGCFALKEITLPDGIEYITEAAFEECTSLQRFNSKYASADGRALIMNETMVAGAYGGLSSYTVPHGVKRIGPYAFGGVVLESVILPEGLECIESRAFELAAFITSIKIPDSVVTIQSDAFSFCERLSSVTLSEQLEYIGGEAFHYTVLTTVVVPSSVKYIGVDAFNSGNLESVYMKPLLPPTLAGPLSENKCPIYVPSSSLNEYKSAEVWRDYQILPWL